LAEEDGSIQKMNEAKGNACNKTDSSLEGKPYFEDTALGLARALRQ